VQNAVQAHLSNASRFRRCGLLLARNRSRKRGLPRPPPRVPSQDSYRPIRKKASSSVVGKKRVTRSTQAATKSAKSGFIQTHQKESFLFRRWQETRHEVYPGRHQECQVRRQTSQKERFLPSLARETRHEVYPDRHQECQVRRQTSRKERPLPSLPGKVRCHL
jgi:hypothetical protein